METEYSKENTITQQLPINSTKFPKRKAILILTSGLFLIFLIIISKILFDKPKTLSPQQEDETIEININQNNKYELYMNEHNWKLHTNIIENKGLLYTLKYPQTWDATINDEIITVLSPTPWDIHYEMPEGHIIIYARDNPDNLSPEEWNNRYNRYKCQLFHLNGIDACRIVVKGANSPYENVGILFNKNGYIYSINAIQQGTYREEIKEVFPYVLASFTL